MHPMAADCSRSRLRWQFLAVLALLFLLGPRPANAGLLFQIIKGQGLVDLESGTPAQQLLAGQMLGGMQQAFNAWSAIFRDDMTVNIEFDYQPLGGSTLANTINAHEVIPYSSVRSALSADRTSPDDFAAVANLSNSSAIRFYTNHRNGTKYLNSGTDPINTDLFVSTANLKAMGQFLGDPTSPDATITFSSDYNFSFNHAAVTPGTHDFVGVAMHELGHALGFSSAVDAVDLLTGSGPYAGVDLNGALPGIGEGENIPAFSTLDLFRHSATSAAVGSTTLDLATGGTPFFSIDGTTNLGRFSTGEYNGDGRQASHWRFTGQGIMQPTLAAGATQNISPLDIRALDVIGYTLVPEPSGYALTAVAMLSIFVVARARSQASRARSW